eukprot:TRINITY_DN1448_c0_g1_i1.p1 TRINITY_DN1448_c0_g1~~TRINITY_DN1448_c0_g1_i1.p1  ORF type:complete len:643 (+),score=268.24 TRINITY_DN1448_c0_g1_i1:47-1975(+)
MSMRCVNASDIAEIVRGDSGIAAAEPVIVPDRFRKTAKDFPNKAALRVKRDGQWVTWTYSQYVADVEQFARALVSIGVPRFAGVSIIGFNAPEWVIANVGTIFAGGIAAGIYTTNGPDAAFYIADHSDSAVIVVEDQKQLDKFLSIKDKLTKVKAIVVYQPGWTGDHENVYSWADFMKLGEDKHKDEVESRISKMVPGNCCSLIYTSGTTGNPKAVMISHDNATWTAQAMIDWFETFQYGGDEHIISYLPLSHIAAQMADIYVPVSIGATVHFAQPDALKGSLGATLKEVRPTFFFGVPRVWEKMAEAMKAKGKANTGVKKSLVSWAKGVGLDNYYRQQRGEGSAWGTWFANALVFSKVKDALGFDRCSVMMTGAAPIAKETLEFFGALNCPVFELYGMSESSGPHTINLPNKNKIGTVGLTMAGVETMLADQDKDGNGEICMKGRHRFSGYMKNEEATKSTIDDQGYLHSGDVGKMDSDGYLSITGRIKELIITAGGENVAPVVLENNMMAEFGDIIANVMTIGDKRKFLSCLVSLRSQPDANAQPTDTLHPDVLAKFKEIGASATTAAEADKDEKVRAYITECIGRANKNAPSNAQCIRKFTIIPREFSLEGGELTPTMKLKRRIVSDKYSDLIEAMYSE